MSEQFETVTNKEVVGIAKILKKLWQQGMTQTP
jgi:hypothetical protein